MPTIMVGLKPVFGPTEAVAWADDAAAWFGRQWLRRSPDSPTAWLLGFADDGLVWGRLGADRVETPPDAGLAVGAILRAETLWRAHLFGPAGELRVWREGAAHRCKWIFEEADEAAPYHDEPRLLVGQDAAVGADLPSGTTEAGSVFSQVRGTAGELHAPPLTPDEVRGAARLLVRHFLSPDERSGMLRVHASRIVCFNKERD